MPDSFKIWVSLAEVNVYITICNYLQADGFGGVTVSAASDTAVDTDVTVYWSWNGDLASTVTSTTTITTGNTNGSTTAYGATSGENFSSWGYLYFSPNPSPGGQTYFDQYCY